jgi:hypothetical protein
MFTIMDKFNIDPMNFILELSGPIQSSTLRFNKEQLSLKYPDLVNIFGMVIGQINDLMIKIFIVLMSLDNAYSL